VIKSIGNKLLERLLENIEWETVEERLRQFIAPEITSDASNVKILHAYWGDLAAQLAWGGASCLPEENVQFPSNNPLAARSHFLADLRQPLNQLGARFFGDIFCYLNNRGDSTTPGPIVMLVIPIKQSLNK
jgi:hypothetical protein